MAKDLEYANELDVELGEEFYEDAQKDRFMTFEIADQDYGIDVMHVTEIVGLQDIAVVPDVPHFVKGMINLRGNVVPVIDVRLRFGLTEGEYDDRTCVVVVTLETSTIGMIVDRVNEVRVITQDKISPPPQGGVSSTGGQYITGLGRDGEDVTVLLDIQQLLDIKSNEESAW